MNYELTVAAQLNEVQRGLNVPIAGHCAGFVAKLKLGMASMKALVISDSTMDQTNIGVNEKRPGIRLAEYLASLNPEITVNFWHWDLTVGAAQPDGFNLGGFSALGSGKSKVIQTGTGTGNGGGPFVLDFYNLAASGTAPSYNQARWTTLSAPFVSIPPEFVIINHGHNIGSGAETNQRSEVGKLIRNVKTKWSFAAVLVTAQNPTDPTRIGYDAGDIIRAAATLQLAAEEGCGLINVYGRYLENPNWATDYLVDKLHENSGEGSRVWFEDCIRPHFLFPAAGLSAPVSPQAARDYLYIPATQFAALVGTPTLAVVNSECHMWALAPGVASAVNADVLLPEHWPAYEAYVCWAVAGTSGYTGSTVAAFRFKRQQRASGIVLPGEAYAYPVPPAGDPGIVTRNPNNGTAYQTVMSQLTAQSTNPKAPLGLQVYRDGGNAADTLTSDTVYIKGLLLAKVLQ